MKKKSKFDDFKLKIFSKFKFPKNNFVIQNCARPPQYIKYCSKEDWSPCVFGIDRDALNINWKLAQIVTKQEVLDPLSYSVRCVPPNFMRKLIDMHTAYWSRSISFMDYELACLYKNNMLVAEIKRLFALNDKKGLWVHGIAGTGKTASCIYLMEEYYSFHVKSNFPMSSFSGEKNLYIDDGDRDSYYKHREFILQATGGFSASYEIKGGRTLKFRLKGKLIITSNCDPPNEPEFLRRFHVVHLFAINEII